MENQDWFFEALTEKETLAYLGFMAVVIYLTKDKYR
jgi:hypothetical protein